MIGKNLTEEDVKLRYVTPAIVDAGWATDQIFMEKYFTAGRISIHGKRTKRGEGRKADYLLCSAPNLPMAIVEAKDGKHQVSDGIQQAIDYAHILGVPFSYSSNGAGFYEHDDINGTEIELALKDFPSPEELTELYIKYQSLSDDAKKALFEPYYFAIGTYEPSRVITSALPSIGLLRLSRRGLSGACWSWPPAPARPTRRFKSSIAWLGTQDWLAYRRRVLRQ